MQDERFDALTRFISRVESRRALIKGAGAVGLASVGLTRMPALSLAQDASPVASPMSDAATGAQAGLDALDPDTKDASPARSGRHPMR